MTGQNKNECKTYRAPVSQIAIPYVRTTNATPSLPARRVTSLSCNIGLSRGLNPVGMTTLSD